MKLKFKLRQFLTMLLLVGVTHFGHAQKIIGKVSGDLLSIGNKQATTSKQADKSNSAARNTDVEIQELTVIDILQIFDGNIVIEAISKDDPSLLLAELQAMGLQKGSYFGGMVSGLFPIDNIARLEGVENLRYVRPAYKPIRRTGSVTSQGDNAQLSDVARSSFGVDGSGYSVGILSDSYDALGGAAAGIASGDLPGAGNPNGFNSEVLILEDLASVGVGLIDEGRGMAELVHDVAPGAGLAFHTASIGQADFANGILELAAAGSDVIVDDVIYFAEPMFQDGIIGQAADMVAKAGVPYFSSAGNNLDESYESEFRNGGTEILKSGEYPIGEYVLHDFDPGPGVDYFQEIDFGPDGDTFFPILQWDDPFASVCAGCPGAATDLDMLIAFIDGDLTSIVGGSFGANIDLDPVEGFNVGASNLKYYIVIGKWTGRVPGYPDFDVGPNPDPSIIKYVNFGSISVTDYATHSSTSYGHANAERAVSVGAVRYDRTAEYAVDPPLREVFSSSGGVPTLFDTKGKRLKKPKVRKKPEISAVQGGNTTFFGGFDYDGDGYPNFFGTSASAPHAAGVAALILEATDGKIKPDKITKAMQKSAVDMDDPRTPEFDKGFDFATGAGFLQADAAVAAALDAPSVYRFVLIDPITDTPIRTLRDGETIELSADEDGVFNIEALVSEDGKKVKHMKFELTSDDEMFKKYKRNEKKPPYALFGEKKGDYLAGSLPVGAYDLKAETEAKKGKKKKKSSTTIAFNIEVFDPIAPVASNARSIKELDPKASEKLKSLADELLNASELIVYPNPSAGQVNFIWNAGQEGKVALSIFDTTGRIVEVYESDGAFEHTIDFSKYQGNIYIARIITPNYTEVRRFIIE